MRCYCGHEYAADSKYCLSCGITLAHSSHSAEPQSTKAARTASPGPHTANVGLSDPSLRKRDLRQRRLIAVLAFLLLGAAGSQAFSYARRFFTNRSAAVPDMTRLSADFALPMSDDTGYSLETLSKGPSTVSIDTAVAKPYTPPAVKPLREAVIPIKTVPAPRPKPEVGIIAAGTNFSATSQTEFCSKNARPGMQFNVPLNTSIEGANGFSIPDGSVAVLVVPEPNTHDGAATNPIGLSITKIIAPDGTAYDVRADILATQVIDKGKGSIGKKAIIGAIAGGVAAKILGKSNNTAAAAAAAGAAAGTAVGELIANNYCIPIGGAIDFKLLTNLSKTFQ